MRLSRKLSALGAFFVIALGISACGSAVPGDSVAVVAGSPITTQAFNHWMFVAAKGNATQSPGAPVIVPNDPPAFTGCIAQVRSQIPTLAKTPDKTIKTDCAMLFKSLSSQVMDFLIKAYWYQADAFRLHINVTNAQVEKMFATDTAQQFKTPAALQSFLSQTGQTKQDIIFRIRVNQIYKDLIARYTPKVTTAAIAAYYSSHKSQFGTPATRNLRIVRTKTQSQAAAALAALKSGQSWTTVAKQFSIDTATKNNGGLLTDVTSGEEEKALNQVAFSAPLNKLEGPVHGTFGWYVVQVVKITNSTQSSLTAETSLIKQLLTSQGQTKAQSKVDAHAKKDWGKQTDCRSAYAMTDCNGYKAPKTPTTPVVTPTTATPTTATPTTSTGTASTGTSTTG